MNDQQEPEERQALWQVFLTSRTEQYLDARMHRKKLKGRELNPKHLPGKYRDGVTTAFAKEWQKWINHDATEILTDDEQAAVLKDPKANIVDVRSVVTDKAEPERGDRSMDDVPPDIRARLVTKGFQDRDPLAGKLKTDAPTLPTEVMHIQLVAAQPFGHKVEQGAVEAAFLNSPPMTR